jgi:hypothetical protein
VDIVNKYLAAEGVRGTRAQPTFLRATPGYHKDAVQEQANVPVFDAAGGINGLLISEGGLYLNYAMINSGGNCYHYVDMPGVSDYVIQSGDYLEYDVFWFTDAPVAKYIAFDYTTSDGSTLREGSVSDQNGLGISPGMDLSAYASGRWYHRKVPLPGSHTGKTIRYYDLACELNSGGSVEAMIKTIRVTNGSGTVRKNIWSCGDPLPALAVHLTTSASQSLTVSLVSGETLTIPSANVMNLSCGTVEFLVSVSDALKNNASDQYLFAHVPDSSSSNNLLTFRHISTGGFRLIISNAAGDSTGISTMELSNGAHRIALRWDYDEAAIFVDGAKYRSLNPRLPEVTAASVSIGYWPSATGPVQWCNTCISDLMISNRPRSDIELATRSGLNRLIPDPGTTYHMPLDGSMAVTTTIDDGAQVVEKRFRYIKCSEAIASLAEGSEYTWYIDPYRWLRFKPRDAYPAPWTITGSDILKNTEMLGSEAPDYRNRQYVLGVKQLTSLQTEHKKGDGAATSWTVGYPIAEEPAVSVGAASKTVGIRGSDSGKDFYWSKGDNTITQDSDGVVLAPTDTLNIVYKGMYDIVIMGENTAAIQDRRVVEGGTGYVDDVMEATLTTDTTANLDIANGKLSKYGVVSRRFEFSTNRPGLEPGQIAQVDVPEHFLMGEMLVEKVGTKDNGNTLTYSVSVVDGPVVGSWAKSMAEMGGSPVITEDSGGESVIILVSNTETMTVSGTCTVTVNACPLPGPATYPATNLYPC